MADMIPIVYGEFYDFPRMLRFQIEGEWFLLRSFFDEERDEYSACYDVYLLPFRSEEDFKTHPDYWMSLGAAVHLGQIPVADAGLDATRRHGINAGVITRWLSALRKSVAP